MPMTKNSDAYRLYTTFVSVKHHRHRHKSTVSPSLSCFSLPAIQQSGRTLVLEEVAHPRPPREDELGDVLYDLTPLLGRHGGEPLREPDLALPRD